MGLVRLLLAVAVVIEHSSPILGLHLTGGRVAVECFFVISAFYMAMVLERKYAGAEGSTWRTFMTSRIMRLFPVYAVVTVATYLLAAIGVQVVLANRDPQFTDLGGLTWWTAALVIASNLTLLGQDLLTLGSVDAKGSFGFVAHPLAPEVEQPGFTFLAVPQAWSISIELAFYMLAPWMHRRRTSFLVVLTLTVLAAKVGLLLLGVREDPWTHRVAPLELCYFGVGMLAYRFAKSHPVSGYSSRFLVPGVLLALASYQLIERPAAAILVPIAFAFIVPVLFEATKNNSFDRRIGELSYPLYIVHLLIIAIMVRAGVPHEGWIAVPVSIAAAFLLYLVIDAPFERARQRWVKRRTSIASFDAEA